MSAPLLPAGRSITEVSPRAGALAEITRRVHHRRQCRRRRVVAAGLTLPALLVAALALSGGSRSQSLDFVGEAPSTASPAPPAPADRSVVPGVAGPPAVPVLRPSPEGSPEPSAAPESRPEKQSRWAQPVLLEMHREKGTWRDDPDCQNGVSQSGWCISALVDEPGDRDRPEAHLALRICRVGPVIGRLAWNTSHETEIEVYAGESLVYRWSTGHTFEDDPHFEDLPFYPIDAQDGSCLRWQVFWPVTDNYGASLDRDVAYTMKAWSYADTLSGVEVSKTFSAARDD